MCALITKERQKIYDEIEKEYKENANEKCYCQKHDIWYSKYIPNCSDCLKERLEFQRIQK